MLDIVVGKPRRVYNLSNEIIVQTSITCMIHTVTLDLAYVDLTRLFIRTNASTVQ